MALIYALSHFSLQCTTFLRMPTVPQPLEGRHKPSSSSLGRHGAIGTTAMLTSHTSTDGGDYGREKLFHAGGKTSHRALKTGTG